MELKTKSSWALIVSSKKLIKMVSQIIEIELILKKGDVKIIFFISFHLLYVIFQV